jgi:hypothetical protein
MYVLLNYSFLFHPWRIDPDSKQYGRYLSLNEINARFGARRESFDAVISFLKDSAIDRTPPHFDREIALCERLYV